MTIGNAALLYCTVHSKSALLGGAVQSDWTEKVAAVRRVIVDDLLFTALSDGASILFAYHIGSSSSNRLCSGFWFLISGVWVLVFEGKKKYGGRRREVD